MKHAFSVALLAGLASVMVPYAASAHGGKTHEAKAFDPTSAEQKPYGIAGDPRKATRTVRIAMTDNMRFSPSTISVREGETVKFVVSNKGRLMHEMVIGTRAELEEHAELMRRFPDMEHDEPHMAHVDTGKSETLTWHFNRVGEFEFACLLPGHFEAGMKGRISVRPR